MGLADQIAEDIAAEIIPELDKTALIAGASYRCFPSTVARETLISTDGNPVEVKLSLVVLRADFDVFPGSGAKVTYPETNGRVYKVGRIRDMHGAAAWLDCIDAGR
jgi:hypothetical protein